MSNKIKRNLSVIVLIFLTITLGLFVWAVATQRLDLRKRASTAEPSVCIATNKVINVTPYGEQGTCHDIQTAINMVDGSDFTINLASGTYNVPETGDLFSLNIFGKSNLTIVGDSGAGSSSVVLRFTGNRGGIRVMNSSGSIQWLTVEGNVANGMVSISDNSNNFEIAYANINSSSAHAVDISQASNISIYNSKIVSSAGAIEAWNVSNLKINNNEIYDSDNAIMVEGSDIDIIGNLIRNNSESGLLLRGLQTAHIENNTIIHNGSNQYNTPAVRLDGSGNSNMHFNNNIVAFNEGPGIYFNSYQNFTRFTYNNFYNQTTSTFPNYVDMADQTGVLGNISADPLINMIPNGGYCLYSNSPSLYMIEGNSRYMGYRGSCGVVSPSPSPTTSSSPTSKIGDVNNDNKVNLIDIGIVVDYYDSTNPSNPRADVDGSGKVDLIDIGLIIDRYEW